MRWRPPVPGKPLLPSGVQADGAQPDGALPDGAQADASEPTADSAPTPLDDPSLLSAFWQYECALMTNSVPDLDRLFAGGDQTIRSDGGSTLVGHDAIAAFRASRPAPPQRYLRRVHLRPISDDAAVIVAESVRDDRGTGVQTQLWQRDGAESPWAVTVAHVSTVGGPTRSFDQEPLPPEHERAIWATPADRRPLLEAAAPIPASGRADAAPEAGSLAGVRVAVKDLFAIVGETIGAGNPAFRASRSPEASTAPAVQALIDAGAEITGLAQTDELAFSIAGTNIHFGTPPNPAAPGRISGGSTSGPASAVALGLADLALGTDTAGSIRVPGSYTGLYGLRTTHDAVSREGLIPLAPSFDTVGVLARDLATLTAGAEAILATGAGAGTGTGASATAGHPAAYGLAAAGADSGTDQPITRLLVDPALVALADPGVRLGFEASLRALSVNSGAPVEPNSGASALRPADLERWFTAFRVAQQFEAWQCDREFVTANPGALDPAIAERFRVASTITESEIADARRVLAEATDTLEALIEPGTALALPSTSSVAPEVDASPAEIDRVRGATLRLTCLSSLSGLPALTLPYGSVAQLPFGLCLVGPRGSDRRLLEVAEPRRPTMGSRLSEQQGVSS